MTDLTRSLKLQLKQTHLPGLQLPSDLQVPVYNGYSIANIPASIFSWLNLKEWPTVPLAAEIAGLYDHNYRQVIQIVVDGMGLELFQRFDGDKGGEAQNWQTLLQSGSLAALTSTTPATTSAALTSFWTGKTPAQHGITGYEMWLREYNLAANMITHTPAFYQTAPGSLAQAGFNPKEFLPCKTLGPALTRQGVQTFVLQHKSITNSGVSTMLFDQTTAVPFRGLQDLFITLEDLASEGVKQKRFIYAYWSDLDELQHVYGSDDLRVKQEFFSIQRAVTRLVSTLRKQGRGDTLILLTADHGQVTTELSDRYVVQKYPELVSCLHMLPTGESRLPYLYLRPNKETHVRELIETYWPGKFLVLGSEAALETGLFGPAPYHNDILSRLGDLILIALDDSYLYWPLKENRLYGRHGGMNQNEMFVPLAMFEC
jgi:hypothetical protein